MIKCAQFQLWKHISTSYSLTRHSHPKEHWVVWLGNHPTQTWTWGGISQKQQKESHLFDGNSISTSLVRAGNQPQQHKLNCFKIFNYSHKLARKLKLNVTQRNLYPASIFWLIILISSLLPLLKFDTGNAFVSKSMVNEYNSQNCSFYKHCL